MSEIAVSPDKLYELERFLYKEASFLDRPDLDKWMQLRMARTGCQRSRIRKTPKCTSPCSTTIG